MQSCALRMCGERLYSLIMLGGIVGRGFDKTVNFFLKVKTESVSA